MKAFSKDRLYSWALIAALASVLLVLGLLQYRWSGLVSEAATERMQVSLNGALLSFRQDLGRELARLGLELQPERGSRLLDAAGLASRLGHWQRTSPHPALVGNVYLWDPESVSLLRLDAASDRLEPVAWPDRFVPLRDRLGAITGELKRMPQPPDEPVRGPGAAGRARRLRPGGPPWAIDQSVPALVYPNIVHVGAGQGASVTWMLIELNQAVLHDYIFPELTVRYLANREGLVYQVAVIGGGSERSVLYSTGNGFGNDPESANDGEMNLFGPHGPARVAEIFLPSRPRTEAPPGERADSGPMRLETLHYSPGDRDWRVIVKHRSGSVEAAVTMLRRRNLAVGFGVLAVLAVTMALVMVNAQRARTLARLQMDFVAGISHELRTPLAVISSAAENLADGVVDNPRQQQRYGAIIRNHARQLTQLVEQVLLFASTSEGKQGLHLLPLEVKQVVENAVESTASTVSGAGFRLEVQVAPALPRVMADAAALAQCLQNLITNAVKYGGEARWIGLTAVSEADSAGAEVRITVADRGIGIAESEMSHIFEPFYRSPAVVGSQIHGSGLGLALTQRITQAMGGRVSLKSEVGRGSSFTLHLPAAPESVAAEEPAVASVPEVPKVPS